MSALRQYQLQFAGHLRDARRPPPAGVDRRGARVYRELVYNNFEQTLAACFPVTKRVLGRTWPRLVRSFIRHHRCSSPLFRDIPAEFLGFVEAGAAGVDLPPFLASLAHYEWIELALSISAAEPPADLSPTGDLLDASPVLAPAHALLAYAYAVHRIRPGNLPTGPDAEPTHILVFRRPDFEIGFAVLNPVSARLVALLEQGMRGREALLQIAAELQHPEPAVVLSGGLEILENLREQQAIWGVRHED